MRGDQDARALVIVADDGIEDIVPRGGIDAADGLVEQVEPRPAAHDQDELHLLAGALGHLAVFHVRVESEPRHHVGGAGAVKVLEEVGEVVHELVGAHPLGQAGPVGQIADDGLCLLSGQSAADADLAGGRRQQAVGQLDERGFAAAVGAEQANDAARRDAQRHAVERLHGAEALRQVSAFKTGFHSLPPCCRTAASSFPPRYIRAPAWRPGSA